MAKKLNFSPAFRNLMYQVEQYLELGNRDHLWTLRIALARSLHSNMRISLDTTFEYPENIQEKKPFDIPISTLEQKDSVLFRALIQQLYQKKMTDEEYIAYLTKHIEHGLVLIEKETKSPTSYRGYEYLNAIARRGMQEAGIPSSERAIVTASSKGYEDILSIRIGVEKDSGEPQVIQFNKTDIHLNNYMGIVGRPGSGKTYFVKYFLRELRKISQYKTNFIIFDYAKGDIAEDKEFISKTKATLIDVSSQPIPINIFKVPHNSYREKKLAAERIVGIVRNVEANIGKVQEQNLYESIVNAYETVMREKQNPYPDFHIIREELENINTKPDSLTSVFRPLTEHNLFATREMKIWDSLVNRTVVLDIHKLPALKDLCVFLVLNELYRQLMLMPDSIVNPKNNAREMRTVIVIDEAHHFLKSKKRVTILENLIREIRSKGASVILLSQSPDDYDQTDFNFLELLEFVYVLGCNPSSYKFLQQVFGLSAEQAKKLSRDVTALKQGEAYIKGDDKKPVVSELCR